MTTMMGALLPPAVICAEAFEDRPGEPVHPGEEHLVAGAVPGRRSEFVTGRRCAREALGRLGFAPAPIGSGPRREPRWPAGAVGSITHCAGYRAAAVARAGDVAGLGIDAETHAPLPAGVLDLVSDAHERAMLEGLAVAGPGIHWDRLLFSAKESVYKAWFPLTARWLDFHQARLRIDPDGTFVASVLLSDTPLPTLAGRHLVRDGFVLTAVTVAA